MKSEKILTSRSVDETVDVARQFAKELKAGDVIALEGGLGSGKTTFVKGLAQGLGLKKTDEVTSPTFTLLHIYPTRIPLYHFDLYRLDRPGEIAAIGFEEFVNQREGIVCVEWAEKAGERLPKNALRIRFETEDEHSRKIFLPSSKRGL